MAYWHAARITDAVELGERVLADSERSLGPERPETLRARLTLAVYYTEAGRTMEAIELAERVLPDFVRTLGREHPDTLAAGESLAVTYAGARRLGEAIKLGERVLTDCELLGPTTTPTETPMWCSTTQRQHVESVRTRW